MFESRLPFINTLNDLLNPDLQEGVDYAIICSLFRNPVLKGDIDKIYNAHKVEIINSYIDSPIYKNKILNTVLFSEADIASKVVGIYYWSIKNKNNALLTLTLKTHKELQKSYKLTKRFTEQAIISTCKDVVDLTYNKTNTTETAFKSQEAILTALKLSDLYNIPMYKLEDKPRDIQRNVSVLFYGIIHFYYDTIDNLLTTNMRQRLDLMKDYTTEVIEYKKAWGIHNSKTYNFGYFDKTFDINPNGFRHKSELYDAVIPAIPETLEGLFFNESKYPLKDLSDFSNGIERSVTTLNGYDLHDIDDVILLKSDLDYAITLVLVEAEVNKLSWELSTSKVLIHIKNGLLYNDYRHTRHIALNTKQIEIVNEVTASLKDKDDELKKVQNALTKSESKVSKLEDKVKQAEESRKQLDKQNKELQTKLSNVEPNAKELKALRDMMYELQKDSVEDTLTDESRAEKVDYINKHKLVILGGNERWVVKMKEYLVNATWLSPDVQNRNLNALKQGAYTMLVNTATNSHSTTRKVIPMVERNDEASLIMMPSNFGIDRTINYIYNALH